MPRFQPFLGMYLRIGPGYFEFMPHPLFPQDKEAIFVVEGGEALVYQMRNMATQELCALKVIKPVYQGEHLARVAEALTRYADIPGLYLKHRVCLTKERYPELLATFPELEYATLMPWLSGHTWGGVMLNQASSANYSVKHARALALAVTNLLWNLEMRSLAHTDIAGGNLLLSSDVRRIQLLDVESMYIPDLPSPKKFSQGSPGYQHRHLGAYGQWCPEGDRFAGAILLTEILTWWNPRIRAHIADHAESLFRPEELQTTSSTVWQEVRNILWGMSPELLQLFDQAWSSNSLAECPDFATWARILSKSFM